MVGRSPAAPKTRPDGPGNTPGRCFRRPPRVAHRPLSEPVRPPGGCRGNRPPKPALRWHVVRAARRTRFGSAGSRRRHSDDRDAADRATDNCTTHRSCRQSHQFIPSALWPGSAPWHSVNVQPSVRRGRVNYSTSSGAECGEGCGSRRPIAEPAHAVLLRLTADEVGGFGIQRRSGVISVTRARAGRVLTVTQRKPLPIVMSVPVQGRARRRRCASSAKSTA